MIKCSFYIKIKEVKKILLRNLVDSDRGWVSRLLSEHWGSAQVATRGRLHQADELPGFAAITDDCPSGLLTYRIDENGCEIVSLNSLIERVGIGTALLNAARSIAESSGCRRMWLITTNDNLHAIRFYQKYGFTIAAVHVNSIEELRKLKPEIPLIGIDGIPIRDEIEFEIII